VSCGKVIKMKWTFVVGGKAYTSNSRHLLKHKRKALRSNPTFTGTISDIIPISLSSESGEARMPIIYVANIKRSEKNASP
jgi:hypothetical protein